MECRDFRNLPLDWIDVSQYVFYVALGIFLIYGMVKGLKERKEFRKLHEDQLALMTSRRVRDTTGELPLYVSQRFLGHRFEFYDDFFRHSLHGKVKHEVMYSEIRNIGPYFFWGSNEGILLIAHLEDLDVSFVVNKNPYNKQLGVKLFDWLETKIQKSHM